MEIDRYLLTEKQGAVALTNLRPYVAVASLEGLFINLHLGESESLRIFRPDARRPELVDIRSLPGKDINGIIRWKKIAALLKDCSCLLVNGIGPAPRSVLMNAGIDVYIVEGFVDKAISSIGAGRGVGFMLVREPQLYASPCSGDNDSGDEDAPFLTGMKDDTR